MVLQNNISKSLAMNKLRCCVILLLVLVFSIKTPAQSSLPSTDYADLVEEYNGLVELIRKNRTQFNSPKDKFWYHAQQAIFQHINHDARGLQESLASCEIQLNKLSAEEIEEYKQEYIFMISFAWYQYLIGYQAFEKGQYQNAEVAWVNCFSTLKSRLVSEQLPLLYMNVVADLGCLYFILNNAQYAELYLQGAKQFFEGKLLFNQNTVLSLCTLVIYTGVQVNI